jgi:2-hydroxycyclohexanecarboxyl-CoA dehydrogenase
LATARAFAAEGSVALWDLSPAVVTTAAQINKEFGVAVFPRQVDMADFDAVQTAFDETKSKLGAIVHVVHCASVGSHKFGFPFTNLTPNDWRKVLEVNIMGMVNVAHAATNTMIQAAGEPLFFWVRWRARLDRRLIHPTARARPRISTSHNVWPRTWPATAFASTPFAQAWCNRH